MSARYRLGRLANSGDISNIQNKLENLYDDYNYNTNCTNYSKCADLIEENANVQSKLYSSLTDIATDSTSKCPIYTSSVRPSRCYTPTYCSTYYPRYYSSYYPYYYPSTYCASLAAASAASAALAATSRLSSVVSHQNAEISDLSYKYSRDVNSLEHQLANTKNDKADLAHELNHVKDELTDEKRRSSSANLEARLKEGELRSKLHSAELKLASAEPKAALARTYERQISNLNSEISLVRSRNNILASHNDFQDRLIRSRAASPCYLRSRSISPCYRACSPLYISPYRRTFASDYCAPLVSHHVWPCLTRDTCVLSKGDACTARAPTLSFRSRPCSPVLTHTSRSRLRSCSPICTRAVSPITTTTTTTSYTRTYSPYRCWY